MEDMLEVLQLVSPACGPVGSYLPEEVVGIKSRRRSLNPEHGLRKVIVQKTQTADIGSGPKGILNRLSIVGSR